MRTKELRPRISPEEYEAILKMRSGETPGLDKFADKVRAFLKQTRNAEAVTVNKLANKFDVSPKKITDALKALKDAGYNVSNVDGSVLFSTIIPKRPDFVVDQKKIATGVFRFGAVGDNHLGSKYERLDVLHSLYDYFASEGITEVFNTGNWIDGEARFNKHDLHTHGLDNQLNYMLKMYPRRDGITTHYVAGDDHEGWYVQREGIDVGYYLEKLAEKSGRKDLKYLGYMEADVILPAKKGATKLRVVHPGGGSAYAISYTMQKLVESYQEGEKPNIVLAGHYHKHGYQMIRGVHTFQTGTTQDQTPFMRKKKISAHVGGWIIEVHTDENGAVVRVKSEWIPFYNKEYYGKPWRYQFGDKRGF